VYCQSIKNKAFGGFGFKNKKKYKNVILNRR